MRLVWFAVVILGGCTHVADRYGGGDGLTLELAFEGGETTTITWAGATKGELRDSKGVLPPDDVAMGIQQVDSGSWVVTAASGFTGIHAAEELGLPCDLSVREWSFGVNGSGVTLTAEYIDLDDHTFMGWKAQVPGQRGGSVRRAGQRGRQRVGRPRSLRSAAAGAVHGDRELDARRAHGGQGARSSRHHRHQ